MGGCDVGAGIPAPSSAGRAAPSPARGLYIHTALCRDGGSLLHASAASRSESDDRLMDCGISQAVQTGSGQAGSWQAGKQACKQAGRQAVGAVRVRVPCVVSVVALWCRTISCDGLSCPVVPCIVLSCPVFPAGTEKEINIGRRQSGDAENWRQLIQLICGRP